MNLTPAAVWCLAMAASADEDCQVTGLFYRDEFSGRMSLNLDDVRHLKTFWSHNHENVHCLTLHDAWPVQESLLIGGLLNEILDVSFHR